MGQIERTCRCRSRKMDPGILLPSVEFFSNDLFAISICEEVYGARRDNADKGWTKAFEQGRHSFIFVDISMCSFSGRMRIIP